ncbi:hypothetical protein MIS45_07520 [Wielerella bovis]|uniref:hypothetical protein n=1 Tax=Wielerella bovis TaxID=2917790 RepID=UPI002019BD10|nr:hypothetical protein [Wielerella bovis]ULJ68644.1 hypothetical protein MIS45_07520 [Wielerella bovis]
MRVAWGDTYRQPTRPNLFRLPEKYNKDNIIPDFPKINLQENVNVPLTLGHLFIAWHTLSQHFGNLREYEYLTEAERRAILGLEDAFGRVLSEQGLGKYSMEQANELLVLTREHMNTVHIECLDENP